jgi:hypothetical protein
MKLTKAERVELTKRANSRSLRAEDARRARCVLLLAEGNTWAGVRSKLECNDEFIAVGVRGSALSGWLVCIADIADSRRER